MVFLPLDFYVFEVKSGRTGDMKSLRLFLESHSHSKYGLKISLGTFSQHNHLIEIPLYGLESYFNDTP